MRSDRRKMIAKRALRGLLMRMGVAVVVFGALTVAAGWIWPSAGAMQSDLSQLHLWIESVRQWHDDHPVVSAVLFVLVFVVLGLLPVPAAATLTLAGGAFFGFWLGFVLATAASTISAVVAFWLARHVLNRPIRRIFGARLQQVDQAVHENGTLALLSMRLTFVMPFFLLNNVAGISRMRADRFALVTFVGILPTKAILAAAGTQLAEINRVSDVFGPRLMAVLVMLAVLPWIMRWITRLAGRLLT
ncbi:TVP38/TMEM64 family protein [Paracoccus sp. (in: a-proteobacteria)]|uniref:TVP38/TMEM64 family protein n=1 Tax=Paracoccus sp. TaxID=267 RepID=UPI0026DFF469|nr:VTT domain-containing protein [Paracoccus sp. (in: a-proteobacteria)]MDO5647148.1 VTT domain-containing protein [Paracoccus sp. (in: a-proteobacteria)]